MNKKKEWNELKIWEKEKAGFNEGMFLYIVLIIIEFAISHGLNWLIDKSDGNIVYGLVCLISCIIWWIASIVLGILSIKEFCCFKCSTVCGVCGKILAVLIVYTFLSSAAWAAYYLVAILS